jgi:hypothetical protein
MLNIEAYVPSRGNAAFFQSAEKLDQFGLQSEIFGGLDATVVFFDLFEVREFSQHRGKLFVLSPIHDCHRPDTVMRQFAKSPRNACDLFEPRPIFSIFNFQVWSQD